MSQVLDILGLLKSKCKEQDSTLRIIQTTFSLLESSLLEKATESIFTRIYALCFQCSEAGGLIANISLSALSALTEIIFGAASPQHSASVLQQLLEFTIHRRRLTWLNSPQFTGTAWDLITVAVRSVAPSTLIHLRQSPIVSGLLKHMYKIATENSFRSKERDWGSPEKGKGGKK